MKWYPSLGVFTLAIMVGANAAEKVEVSNLTVTDTASGKIHYIQGTAHNVSGAPLGFVALTFKLYDSEDNGGWPGYW
ncbi:FxLYD domain-containing protein, partial [Pseudomonas tremae]|uniref:FxLYD domain-containing protein n=1 Tax=Pseudomonas tremae TaxID=200454 RepID=UPI000AB8186F